MIIEQKYLDVSLDLEKDYFSLCVSWNTNGWNFDKKKTVLNSLFQCTNLFSYAFKKQEMVQVLIVNIHVEYH